MMDILIVDDDSRIGALLSRYLTREGYSVRCCGTGPQALAAIAEKKPALVLLDIMLPHMDGFSVLENIRKTAKMPVIMLTARDEARDKMQGFSLGADDYIVKPFDPNEVVARVKAVCRRAYPQEENRLTLADVAVDRKAYSARIGGAEIEMPRRELELLFFLMQHKGEVYTREQLLCELWGADYEGDNRTVDVHIKRLRDKLAPSGLHIATVWGVGYRLEEKICL